MMVDYNNIKEYLDWTAQKAEIKYNSKALNFPVLPNCLYWAFMGDNIGSEEGKHRPILVLRTYKNSPLCSVVPLTTQRLNDGYWYHIDLKDIHSSVLCEQMRTMDQKRIDKPYRIKGKIAKICASDWDKINKQIKWLYRMTDLK